MNYRPAGYSSDEEDDLEGFSFGGETKTVREKQAEITVQTYKKRLDLNNTSANRLYSALVIGNLESVRRELKGGANVNCKLPDDYTPLLLAASQARSLIVAELLNRGAKTNTHKDGFNALMAVCDCNKSSTSSEEVYTVVEQLLKRGVNVKAIDRKRRTALMLASAQGFPKVVEILLSLSKLDAEDNQGWTALFYAVNANNAEVVKLLLDAGANLNHCDVRLNDVKYYANINDHLEVLNLLPKIEAEISPEDLIDEESTLESIFEDLQKYERPEFLNDVRLLLYGMQCQQLIPLFQQSRISLYNFLVLDDVQLQAIGVEMSFQRNRILRGLYNFHKFSWKQKSLPTVSLEDAYSTYHIMIAVANAVKHLTVMESSLKYLKKGIELENLKPDKEMMETKMTNMLQKFYSIRCIAKLLHKSALQFDSAVPNQPDLITKKFRFKKRSWFKYCTFASVLCIPVVIMLRRSNVPNTIFHLY